MIAEARKCGSAEQAGAAIATRERRGVPRWMLGVWVLGVNWEVVRWYGSRLGDGGDEPWGLGALVAALVLTSTAVWRARMSNTALVLSAGLALAAVVGAGFFPMLVRGGLVAGAVGVVIGGGGGTWGRLGLLGLSLPVMATAQFYAGYPLRVITAELGRPLLSLFGVATERTGVVLTWARGEVIVDAPCSGVRMLWAGAALACGLAAWRGLSAWRTGLLIAGALAGVVVANAVRAAVLFLTESGVWANAGWVHESVGAVLFGAVAAGMWVWAERGRGAGGRKGVERNAKSAKVAKEDGEVGEPQRMGRAQRAEEAGMSRCVRWVAVGLGLGGLGWSVASAQLSERKESAGVGESGRAAVVWPEVFEGELLRPVGTPERLGAFAGGFAGETRVFEQRARMVVVRWLRVASRTVHPAADCFRARGYRVEERGLVKDGEGGRWSEFVARRDDETWRVRERWRDEQGQVWTDVSAWWWSAQKAETGGPWWAEAVMERE